MKNVTLVVLPGLKGVPRPTGKIILTRKFIEGMTLYRNLWKGPVTLICEPTSQVSDNLDNIEVNTDALPFRTICEPLSDALLKKTFVTSAIVLSGTGMQFNGVSATCKESHIPCVHVTEYTLKTRLQIVREYQQTPLHGWWRSRWEANQERKQTQALSLATGIQCNGTPTYNEYRGLTPNPLLFFDTRTTEQMLANQSQIENKACRLGKQPIHLIFSGRLNLMKGVPDLPKIAHHLVQMEIPFKMSICGDGEYAPEMRRDLIKLGVADLVSLRGVLDFYSELVPFVTTEADLFVCCHRQGDPSCTYLETMACGVPIVGYDNEAFAGLAKVSGAGWVVQKNTPRAIAEQIAVLYRKPDMLVDGANKSLAFARSNTFEKTFRRRIDHLDSIVDSQAGYRPRQQHAM